MDGGQERGRRRDGRRQSVSAAANVFGLSGYNSQLAANTGKVLSWSISIENPYGTPSGLGGGQFGLAFVLGGTSANFRTGDGYAVIVGESSAIDRWRLLRYTNGLASHTDLIADNTDVGQFDRFSLRVEYDVDSGAWELYRRRDAAITDPNEDPPLLLVGSATDMTHANKQLGYLGGFWKFGVASKTDALFDYMRLDVASTATVVRPRTLVWAGTSGAWDTESASWTDGGAPATWDDQGDDAAFGADGARAVSLSGPRTARRLSITAGDYELSGGKLTLSGEGAGIDAQQGATITTPVELGADQAWAVAGGQTLVVGDLDSGGHVLSKTGGGTLAVTGVQSHGAGSLLEVEGGVLRLESDAGAGASIAVGDAGRLVLDASQHLGSLTLYGGASVELTPGGGKVLVLDSLSFQSAASGFEQTTSVPEPGVGLLVAAGVMLLRRRRG